MADGEPESADKIAEAVAATDVSGDPPVESEAAAEMDGGQTDGDTEPDTPGADSLLVFPAETRAQIAELLRQVDQRFTTIFANGLSEIDAKRSVRIPLGGKGDGWAADVDLRIMIRRV